MKVKKVHLYEWNMYSNKGQMAVVIQFSQTPTKRKNCPSHIQSAY